MIIRNATIHNYKSFRESPAITFGPGFNVIVGKNDAGKTALLEALSLDFSDKPHRSLVSIPYAGAPAPSQSSIELTVEISGPELAELIATHSLGSWLPVQISQEKDFATRFETLSQSGAVLDATYANGTFQTAKLRGFPPPVRGQQTRCVYLKFDAATRKSVPDLTQISNVAGENTLPYALAALFKQRIYAFRAERLNLAESAVGNTTALAPNASNLAQVLQVLQSKNPPRFARFISLVKAVFPHIQEIGVPPVGSNTARIFLWSVDPETEREDLTVSLADSGTGIGQVLAILYVFVTAQFPQTILIDEPQSFLHPGAIRKLIELLRQDKRHQFVVTTHSPAAILPADPSAMVLARRTQNGTELVEIDRNDTDSLRDVLQDVGARLSDVFGADRVLWVEGKTEETCFPTLLDKFAADQYLGVQVLGVRRTSDFGKKDVDRTVEIHTQLSSGHALLPPAVGFVLDSEGLDDKQKSEIRTRSAGRVQFLSRRMYENYLLVPAAIASMIDQATNGACKVSPETVSAWIEKNKWGETYYTKPIPAAQKTDAVFNSLVDGATFLHDLVLALTETKLEYRKVQHGLLLTKEIAAQRPTHFEEIEQILRLMVN